MDQPDRDDPPTRRRPARLGVNEAGPGVTIGDWQVGGTVVSGTDDRYDLPQLREAAERREYDAREAARRGERACDPVSALVGALQRHPSQRTPPQADPIMASIRESIERRDGGG